MEINISLRQLPPLTSLCYVRAHPAGGLDSSVAIVVSLGFLTFLFIKALTIIYVQDEYIDFFSITSYGSYDE